MLFLKIIGFVLAGLTLLIVFVVLKDEWVAYLRRKCSVCGMRQLDIIGSFHGSTDNGGIQIIYLRCKQCGRYWQEGSGINGLEVCSEELGREVQQRYSRFDKNGNRFRK